MGHTELSTIKGAFEILELLSNGKKATPSTISEDIDAPLSTVHSYLSTLESIGYLTNDNGNYSISTSLLAIGERARRNTNLYVEGKRVVQNLASELEEQATLSVVEDHKPIVIYSVNENQNMTLQTYPGMALPTYASVAGKLILAHTPKTVDDLPKLEGHTAQTITDRDELQEQVEEIRETGTAFSYEEFKPGLMAIGSPVFHEQTLVGTVSLVAPLEQMKRTSYQETAVRELQTASNTIEVNLRNQSPR